jgi:hypothetical protein
MPKIHVAYRTDAGGAGMRLASGSSTEIKARMRQTVGSEWTVATYEIKPTVKTICTIIENIVGMAHESIEKMVVNQSGQVRKM